MKFTETSLAGVYEVLPAPFVDERGWFTRTYCEREFSAVGVNRPFVQINHSFNSKAGTFRGFHYQLPPHAETKLIRCLSGSVIDIVIDLRKNSPTFLKSIQLELSAANQKMILIPAGLAHGFITLEDQSALLYHHTEFYHRESERGICHTDQKISIQLPRPISVISEKDLSYESLGEHFQGVSL